MPWFSGPSLLEHLETVEIQAKHVESGFRMPVQRVSRESDAFRGYAGTVASGSIRPGDAITVFPSGLESRVKRIATFDGDLEEACAPAAITLELEDQLDISRGDLLFSGAGRRPAVGSRLEAQLVWMDSRPHDPRKRYLLKHTVRTVPAYVTIRHRVNIETLAEEAGGEFAMNAIGLAEIAAAQELCFDPYRQNRTTGSFILIDPETNATAAAGMIRALVAERGGAGPVNPAERVLRWGHRGALIRVAEEAAPALERTLFDRGCAVAIVDSERSADVLARAGMLAILPDEGTGFEGLSEILRRLERERILSERELGSQGEGI
jgi:sulfate adenylyltransferase subunit 1 (EFTu-like GTPase family)